MQRSASIDHEAAALDGQAENSLADEMRRLLSPEGYPSSVDEAYRQILLRIISGDLVANDTLTSTRLAAELGVSRTPVVSAIDRLVSDGILAKENNRRATVHLGAKDWFLQVHQLREIIEPPAAALAAKFITPDALKYLEMLASNAEDSDQERWPEAAHKFDYGLHLLIADHSCNFPLQKAIYKCWTYNQLSYEVCLCIDPELEKTYYREHLAILTALQRGDAETAAIAMSFHLRSVLHVTEDKGIG